MGRQRRKKAPRASADTPPAPASGPGPSWLGFAIGLVAFAVYLPRLCPTVCLIGDSGVFTSAAVVWGVPQPPGYPLFSLIGHLFTLLPIGAVAWRVNLTSAVFHAAAVGVLARVLQRVTRSKIAAVGGALFLAFSGAFFLGSLYAEAFPLNDLFTAVAIAVGLRVADADAASRQKALRAFAVTAGLASAHHQMIALAAPALGVLVIPAVIAEARVAWQRVAAPALLFAGAMAAGYALLLLPAMRDPWVNWGDVRDAAGFVRMITREDYGGMLSPALQGSDASAADHAVVFLSDAWGAFGPLGCGLAVVGVLSSWTFSRRVVLSVVLGFVVSGPVFAMANAIPIHDEASLAFASRFATMSHVFMGLAVGIGMASLERAVALRVRGLAPAVGLAFVVPLSTHASSADLRHDSIGRTYARDLFRDLPDRAVVLGTGDAFHDASSYACAVERLCEGRTVLSPGQLHMAWRIEQLRRRDPSVVLRAHGGRWPRPSDVLQDNAGNRPVLITARLLDVDPSLRERSGYLPRGLLLQAVGEDEVVRGKADLAEDAHAMLEEARCGGCRIGAFAGATSPIERALLTDYTAALDNHAKILALVMGDDADARAVEERARALTRALPQAPP